MIGDNLIQPGPGRVSTAQLAFHVFPAHPLDDRLPTDAPHIDVNEGDITGGTSSEGCVLTTLFAVPRKFLSVSEAPRSRSVNVLVGDNPGDLLTASVHNTPDTLLDSGEYHISREDQFVSRPERRSGREWWGTRTRESRRCETSFFSTPWRQVRRDTAGAGGKVLRFRPLFSANSFLDHAVDDLDGLGADFDRFATYHVGLGQSRARPWIADDKAPRRKRRAGRGRARNRSGCRMRAAWGGVGRGSGGMGSGIGNVIFGCVAHSRNQ